jgi:hypothetical protein
VILSATGSVAELHNLSSDEPQQGHMDPVVWPIFHLCHDLSMRPIRRKIDRILHSNSESLTETAMKKKLKGL